MSIASNTLELLAQDVNATEQIRTPTGATARLPTIDSMTEGRYRTMRPSAPENGRNIGFGGSTFQKVPKPRRGTLNLQTYHRQVKQFGFSTPRIMYSGTRSVLALSSRKMWHDPICLAFFGFGWMSLMQMFLPALPPHYQTRIFRMVVRPTRT